jgi:hypothetical protein
MATKPKAPIHDDSLSTILDRIGIVREELISIERSLERATAKLGTEKADPEENSTIA